MAKRLNKKDGFTLLELLVVIAIIGILSGAVLVSLQGARSKARDAVRKSDIRQVTTAMQLYYVKEEQFFPQNDDSTGIPDIGGFLPSLDDPQSNLGRHYVLKANDTNLVCTTSYLNRSPYQYFCAYAELENPDPKCPIGQTTFIAGSQYGTRIICGAPPTIDSDCTCLH